MPMNQDSILRHLDTAIPVKCFDVLDSTNTLAKVWAREGLTGPAAVLANRQTAGRGRMGRSFFSPDGGIYMSLVVDSLGTTPGQLTTLAAVAVARAAEAQAGLRLQIKWVNDLMLDGKKVCGILTEGVLIDNRLAKTVIGIGINTGPVQFPEELADIAGTLHTNARPIDRDSLAAGIINEILRCIPLIPEHIAAYRALCLTLGQVVRFSQNNQDYEGLAVDVNPDGGLLVQTLEGLIPVIAGEVSIVKSGKASLLRGCEEPQA